VADKDIDRIRRPDIEFEATVHSDELRFEEVPDTEITFHGEPGEDSTSGTERTNLPEEVEPGVTYRDSSVRLRIASRLVEQEGEDEDKG
jgi:hypothetical protein